MGEKFPPWFCETREKVTQKPELAQALVSTKSWGRNPFDLVDFARGKTWCVAKVSATNAQMQAFLDANCGNLGCEAILPGGSCFEPNTVRNHASYAIDLYYRKTGECKSDIGTPSIADPSYGNCQYP
ncbi:Carbohydrate-binding X8 domain superfamily protein [Forsythia ovata]|uniref:Carbohydrate-binding X8 domain superfamily protein n=1 Tax=Forsythia ovata TaxID=205694 RepID=A0ABD1TMG1_9LAMI